MHRVWPEDYELNSSVDGDNMRLAECFIIGAVMGVVLITIFTERKAQAREADRLAKEKYLMQRIIRLEKRAGLR